MFKNYLTIARRNLWRHKGFTVINITGLAVGITCCLLILLYVQDELAYDRYHQNADRIWRVVTSTSESGEPTNANGSFPLGPNLKKDFPEILQAIRFRQMGEGQKVLVTRGERRFYEERFFFADSAVLAVLSFPLLSGNPRTALAEPNTVVLTAAMAQKYFGDKEPLGQVLTADPFNDGKWIRLRVTAVAANLPHQSHFHFDFLASFTSQTDIAGWGNFQSLYTCLLLSAEHDAARLEAQFPAFMKRHMDEPWYSIRLQPLADIRLRSHLRSEIEPNGDFILVYIFSAIALFILLIACINFMNLTTARSVRRAKEVGLRKAAGAHRTQLVKQFLGESMLLSFLAVLLAVCLVEILLPFFNALSGKEMAIHYWGNWLVLIVLAVITLAVGIFSGSYPAFVLSAFRPVEVLKGEKNTGSAGTCLRQGLVVFQFVISIALIVCTSVAYNQMDYIRNKNLGYDREQVLVLPLNNDIRNQYQTFKAELLRHPNVLSVAGSSLAPSKGSNTFMFEVEGATEALDMHAYFVDHDFLRTFGVGLLAGRDFSKAFATDDREAFIINETAIKRLGWGSPAAAVGKQFEGLGRKGRIVGAIRDFHIYSLHREVRSMVLLITPNEQFNYLSVRIGKDEVRSTLAFLEQTWRQFVPNYPFEYFFLDDAFNHMHRAEERLGRVFRSFAFLAIFIACLGLFGLASFTAEQRTKEIGVRKVLGASISNIVLLLSKDFTRLVLIAFAIASPVAYFAMNRWLQNFAYRIDIGWWMFALSGGLALLIAFMTVSTQAIKAALANPVDSLRYE